jgi:hypothetical protein
MICEQGRTASHRPLAGNDDDHVDPGSVSSAHRKSWKAHVDVVKSHSTGVNGLEAQQMSSHRVLRRSAVAVSETTSSLTFGVRAKGFGGVERRLLLTEIPVLSCIIAVVASSNEAHSRAE